MTTIIQVLAAIVLSIMIYGAVKAEIALRKQKSRLKKKRELGEKISRKLDRATELNHAIIDELMKGNKEFFNTLSDVAFQEALELEAMMKEYEAS